MKKLNDPEQEKENFKSELFLALNNSRELTTHEIHKLVVDLMENPEKADFEPEIISIVNFIRTTLKDTSIPVDWLTGMDLRDMQKAITVKRFLHEICENLHNYNLSCNRLLESGKLKLSMSQEVPLNGDELTLLLKIIITKIFRAISAKNGKLSVGEIKSFKILLEDSGDHYNGKITIELKEGDTLNENLHLCPLIAVAKNIAARK
jgi:hypothetical protein